MLTLFYTHIGKLYTPQWFEYNLHNLPLEWQKKIVRYKRTEDKLLRLCGRLLLIKLLEHFGLINTVALTNLKYAPSNKPYFDIPFHFNIAHSGNLVVCAGNINGKVGTDVEKIIPININLLKDQCNSDEWNHITQSSNPLREFYDIWTCKEAVLKAEGSGVNGLFNAVHIGKENILFNGVNYYMHKLNVGIDYTGYVAIDKPMACTFSEVFL